MKDIEIYSSIYLNIFKHFTGVTGDVNPAYMVQGGIIMLALFKMTDGRNVGVNPENVTETFGGNSTTRICFVDGSYTDVECSFEETVKKLNEASMSNGISALIDVIKNQ